MGQQRPCLSQPPPKCLRTCTVACVVSVHKSLQNTRVAIHPHMIYKPTEESEKCVRKKEKKENASPLSEEMKCGFSYQPMEKQ